MDYLPLQPISNADFIVPVEIDGTVHQVSFVVFPIIKFQLGAIIAVHDVLENVCAVTVWVTLT